MAGVGVGDLNLNMSGADQDFKGGGRKKKGGEVTILENLMSIHVITVYKIQQNQTQIQSI